MLGRAIRAVIARKKHYRPSRNSWMPLDKSSEKQQPELENQTSQTNLMVQSVRNDSTHSGTTKPSIESHQRSPIWWRIDFETAHVMWNKSRTTISEVWQCYHTSLLLPLNPFSSIQRSRTCEEMFSRPEFVVSCRCRNDRALSANSKSHAVRCRLYTLQDCPQKAHNVIQRNLLRKLLTFTQHLQLSSAHSLTFFVTQSMLVKSSERSIWSIDVTLFIFSTNILNKPILITPSKSIQQTSVLLTSISINLDKIAWANTLQLLASCLIK